MTLCREEECFACRVGGVVKYSKKQAVPAPEAFLRSSSVVLKAKGTRWGNCLVCIFHPSCSESGFERLEPEAKSQLETLCCWQFSYEVIWVWFWASSIRPGRKGLPRTSRTLSRIVPAKEALSSRTPSARVLEPGSLLWCPGSQIFFRSTKNDIPHTPSTAVHVLSKSQSHSIGTQQRIPHGKMSESAAGLGDACMSSPHSGDWDRRMLSLRPAWAI